MKVSWRRCWTPATHYIQRSVSMKLNKAISSSNTEDFTVSKNKKRDIKYVVGKKTMEIIRKLPYLCIYFMTE